MDTTQDLAPPAVRSTAATGVVSASRTAAASIDVGKAAVDLAASPYATRAGAA